MTTTTHADIVAARVHARAQERARAEALGGSPDAQAAGIEGGRQALQNETCVSVPLRTIDAINESADRARGVIASLIRAADHDGATLTVDDQVRALDAVRGELNRIYDAMEGL